jgi:hypothetical protein
LDRDIVNHVFSRLVETKPGSQSAGKIRLSWKLMGEPTFLCHHASVVGGGLCQPVIQLQSLGSSFGSCLIDECQQNGDAAGITLLHYHWMKHAHGGFARSAYILPENLYSKYETENEAENKKHFSPHIGILSERNFIKCVSVEKRLGIFTDLATTGTRPILTSKSQSGCESCVTHHNPALGRVGRLWLAVKSCAWNPSDPETAPSPKIRVTHASYGCNLTESRIL